MTHSGSCAPRGADETAMGGGAYVPPIGPMGYMRLLSRYRGPYPTADGYLSIVVYTDAQWRAFTQLVGRADILDTDPRFKDIASRNQHAEVIGQFLAEVLATRTTAEWIELLRQVDLPASPVNGIDDLPGDPHLKAINLFEEHEHPTEGRVKLTRFPVRFARTPATIRRLAPNHGEHTREMMAEFGVQHTDARTPDW